MKQKFSLMISSRLLALSHDVSVFSKCFSYVYT